MEEDQIILEGSIEAKDDFAPAPPGHSLTLDNERWPWGKPPRVADPNAAMEQAIDSLEVPKTKQEMFKLIIAGASIEAIVEGYIFQGFQEGRFNPDVGVLMKAALALYIANMCEEDHVPYRFFENKDELESDEMPDETFMAMMKQNNPMMFSFVRESINEGVRRGNMQQPVQEENFISMSREEE